MKRSHKRIGITIGIIVALALFVGFDAYAAEVEYPLDVWRMDLEDAAIGLGTILVGVAAIWATWIKARDAQRRSIALTYQLNGGLAQMAREHVQDNEVIVGLVHRLDGIELQRDDCLDRYEDLRSQVVALGKAIQ